MSKLRRVQLAAAILVAASAPLCVAGAKPADAAQAAYDPMIERHYARYIVDGLEELAARAVVPLIEPASV